MYQYSGSTAYSVKTCWCMTSWTHCRLHRYDSLTTGWSFGLRSEVTIHTFNSKDTAKVRHSWLELTKVVMSDTTGFNVAAHGMQTTSLKLSIPVTCCSRQLTIRLAASKPPFTPSSPCLGKWHTQATHTSQTDAYHSCIITIINCKQIVIDSSNKNNNNTYISF